MVDTDQEKEAQSILSAKSRHHSVEVGTHCFQVRPLLLFSLFLVARARSFFRKYKKKSFLRNRPSCCPPAPSHTRFCLQVAWHDDWKPQSRPESKTRESHFQVVAWTTKIVKGSFFKLQSSWDGASKLKKMAFAIRWHVLEFFKPSTFASTLKARQRRGRSTTTLTLRRSLLR